MHGLGRRTWCLLVVAALTLLLGVAAAPAAQQSLAGPARRAAVPHPSDPITQPRAAQPPPVSLTPPPAAPRHAPPGDLTPPAASSARTPVPYPTADPQDAALLAAAGRMSATAEPAHTPAPTARTTPAH